MEKIKAGTPEYQRAYRKKNPEKVKRWRITYYLRKADRIRKEQEKTND